MSLRKFFFLFVVVSSFLGFGQLSTVQSEQVVEATHQVTETSDDGEEKEKKKKKKDDDKKEEGVEINAQFLISLAVNMISVLIIIGLIYFNNYHKTEILFTYFSFNLVIFLLTLVMNNIKFSTGAAFGLFAVFSMLRYRTEGISTKDMTYLFIVIAIGLICAIKLEILPMVIVCGILITSTFLLDGNILIKRQFSKPVIYENIDLVKPEFRDQLIQDLRTRTGLDVYKVTINKIDFVRDVATIEIFYHGESKK
jgi:cation transport ATPase